MGALGIGCEGTVIKDTPAISPENAIFLQSNPNPSNSIITISYYLPTATIANLIIYDLMGRQVVQLAGEYRLVGWHSKSWEVDTVPSGVYFARLELPDAFKSVKLIVLK